MTPDTTAPRPPDTLAESFDDIVIGSSPLMLLQAGLLAREGRRVCLLERETRLGGSWQTADLDTGETVEIACHLIEVFPGTYEYLEGASGVPFVPLEAQPIRVHRSGLKVPYFSRLLMLASGARLFLGWTGARIAWALGRSTDPDRLINFRTKLASYLRHQGPAFFQRPVMQGPKHGFVDFMDRLVARTRAEGVEIRTFDVQSLTRDAGTGLWHVAGAAGEGIACEHVHCTTSSNLRPVAAGRFEARPQEFVQRLCVVAEVARADIRTSHTYVAFWQDPAVARISRIDMPRTQPFERFLVEFHEPGFEGKTDWHAAVRRHMERAGIVARGGAFQVVGQVNCLFTANVDQLPVGEIDTNLWGYYSMGNLAAGIAAWRKSDRLPPLRARPRHAAHIER